MSSNGGKVYGTCMYNNKIMPCEILRQSDSENDPAKVRLITCAGFNVMKLSNDRVLNILELDVEEMVDFFDFPEELEAFKVYFEHNMTEFDMTDEEKELIINELAENCLYHQDTLDNWMDYLMDKGFEMQIFEYIKNNEKIRIRPPLKLKKKRSGKYYVK